MHAPNRPASRNRLIRLQMQTDSAEVKGLTLRNRPGLANKKCSAVDIPRGQLELSDCDISSNSNACITIYGSASTPTIQRCKIHDGKEGGIHKDGH